MTPHPLSHARLSHRFSEAAFRRFEPTLIAVLDAWPNPTCVLPGALSIETFTHRFRDAVHGFMENGWVSEAKPADVEKVFKFAGGEGTFIVSAAKGSDGLPRVYFGPPAAHGVILTTSLEPAQLSVRTESLFLDASIHPEVVHAFAVLKNFELISDAVTFVNLSDELSARLSADFPNIEFQKAANNQTLMY